MVLFKLSLSEQEFTSCSDFARESARTQRENRSGGTQIRSISMIESDTLRGKVAEVIVRDFLAQDPFKISGIELDFGIYPRGEWDSQDFILNHKKISIKSAKWFSKWLLLETKDIDRGDVYDYYIFVTVDRDFKSGEIKGFASKEEIINDTQTMKLQRGEPIPNTGTILDADNYARHFSNLNNTVDKWKELASELRD